MTIQGLVCKLIERKGKKAEIEIEGQRITISSENLPSAALPGSILKLYLFESEENKLNEKKLAQLILEEILNGQ